MPSPQRTKSNPKQASSVPAPKSAPTARMERTRIAPKPRAERASRDRKAKTSLSALDAAQQALAGLNPTDAAKGLTTKELVERMRRARLWTSPGGKTPEATLYSAMIREITNRGAESRFKRIAPGRFAATRRGRSIDKREREAAPASAPRGKTRSDSKGAVGAKRSQDAKARSVGASA